MGKTAKFKMVFHQLKQDILSGIYPQGNLIPSEKEVCEKYQVSRITARGALKLLEEEGLVEIIPKRGRRVILPRSAIQKKRNEIAVFGLADNFTQNCYHGIIAGLEKVGLVGRFLPIPDFPGSPKFLKLIEKSCQKDDFSGLILVNNKTLSNQEKELMDDLQIPWIQAGTEGMIDYQTVCTDNALAAEVLVDHAVALGHSRISYFHYWKFDEFFTFRNRQAGYLRGMLKHGRTPDCTGFKTGQHAGISEIEKVLQGMFHLGTAQQVTCILFVTSSFAIQIAQLLLQMGYRIPEDISVATFGHEVLDDNLLPFGFTQLTYVEEPMEKVGEIAAQRLLHMMAGEDAFPQQIKINPQLVAGNSVINKK